MGWSPQVVPCNPVYPHLKKGDNVKVKHLKLRDTVVSQPTSVAKEFKTDSGERSWHCLLYGMAILVSSCFIDESQAAAPPGPAAVMPLGGQYRLSSRSRILVDSSDAFPIARNFAADLSPAIGSRIEVKYVRQNDRSAEARPRDQDIILKLSDPGTLNQDILHQGYQLTVSDKVIIQAPKLIGLFYGLQTLRQLFPAWIAAKTPLASSIMIPAIGITDYPRYQYRGLLIDIARHYLSPNAIKRFIDIASEQKLNVLHLHLSDDQGFRVEINGFPNLTKIGGRGSVGTGGRPMDPGGYWTQTDYKDVVAYAAARFMTVMPEVDGPVHNQAIVMSEYWDTKNPLLDGHPCDINADPHNPPRWDYGTTVRFGGMNVKSKNTWTIYGTIIEQLSAMSSSPYFHVGGDEAPYYKDFAEFLNNESYLALKNNKTPMGWAEGYAERPGVTPPLGAVAEAWMTGGAPDAVFAVKKGMFVVYAPADRSYLDQTYPSPNETHLGLGWACSGCDLDQNYCWDPGTINSQVTDKSVIGLEAAMFSEAITNQSESEYMLLPRLWAIAELGWSPKEDRSISTSPAFQNFVVRVASQGARLQAGSTNFFWSAMVPWQITGFSGGAKVDPQGVVKGTLGLVSAPGMKPESLKATIDWGDYTPKMTTSLDGKGPDPKAGIANGLYRLNASHVYRKPKKGLRHTVIVTISGSNGQSGRFLVGL
jgi:hexosaminidase